MIDTSIKNTGAVKDVTPLEKPEEIKAYQAPVDLSDPVDIVELKKAPENAVPKKEASTLKKVGVGAASFIIPGVGQMINGQTGKGLGMMAANIAMNATGLWPVSVALDIFSTVDAVKNAN